VAPTPVRGVKPETLCTFVGAMRGSKARIKVRHALLYYALRRLGRSP
jgi:hypothetical protein